MIYLLVSKTNIVTGHGESSDFLVLAGKPYHEQETYPAFETREKAQDFLHSLGRFTSYKIHEMELK